MSNKTQYYLLIVGLFCLGVFYAALSLATMALYVFIETKMATAIYADTQMQWAFRILCALVAGAIFVLIVTRGSGGFMSMLKKYAALIPLLAFSIGSTMTSNIGMLSENEKEKSNNVEVILAKEKQIESLYIDKKIMQAYEKVSKADEITDKINDLTVEISELKSSQHATIKDKYAGVEIDLYFMTIDVSSVFKVIGGSLGLIALLLEFVFAWSCAIVFAKWFALVSPTFSFDDSERDDSDTSEDGEADAMRDANDGEAANTHGERENSPVASKRNDKAKSGLNKIIERKQTREKLDSDWDLIRISKEFIASGIKNRTQAREYCLNSDIHKNRSYPEIDKIWNYARQSMSNSNE